MEPSTTRNDPRAVKPQSWSNVNALQAAIIPSIVDFTYVTGREPESPDMWLSYNEQVEDLQDQLKAVLREKGHDDEDIWLPRLAPWDGDTFDSGEIQKQIRRRIPKEQAFDRLDNASPRTPPQILPSSLDWCMENEVPQLMAKLREESGGPVTPETLESRREDNGNNQDEARLNRLVANNRDLYECWLNTLGLTFYENERWGDKGEASWDFWCLHIAPSVFEVHVRTTRKGESNTMDARKLENSPRPVITLEQAKRARSAWRASREKGSLSTAGCAVLHAIKGKNPVLGSSSKTEES